MTVAAACPFLLKVFFSYVGIAVLTSTILIEMCQAAGTAALHGCKLVLVVVFHPSAHSLIWTIATGTLQAKRLPFGTRFEGAHTRTIQARFYGHWFSFGAISGLADIAPQTSNLSCKPKHEPLNFFNEVQVVVDGSESICPAPEPSVRKAWSQSSDLHKSLMCAAEKCDSYRAQHTWVCSSGSPHQDLRCRSLARRRQLHRLVSPLAMLRCFALCSFDLRRSPQH